MTIAPCLVPNFRTSERPYKCHCHETSEIEMSISGLTRHLPSRRPSGPRALNRTIQSRTICRPSHRCVPDHCGGSRHRKFLKMPAADVSGSTLRHPRQPPQTHCIKVALQSNRCTHGHVLHSLTIDSEIPRFRNPLRESASLEADIRRPLRGWL